MSEYKLVPIEPTEQMLEVLRYIKSHSCHVRSAYISMLQIVPESETHVSIPIAEYEVMKAMVDEYDELIRYMDAGGDFAAFQTKKAFHAAIK
jgi:hypothetical protein